MATSESKKFDGTTIFGTGDREHEVEPAKDVFPEGQTKQLTFPLTEEYVPMNLITINQI
jgi:Na+-translocating ferredoxin:NAD+ oxidoreductase RnfC subunit